MDPSGWKVPVLVSNFGQETVMVETFSEIGMIAHVSAIQPVIHQPSRPSCDPSMLLEHLRGRLDRTSHDLDDSRRGQLTNTLLQFVDLLPVPGSALDGGTHFLCGLPPVERQSKMIIPYLESTIPSICWPVSSGFQPWIWLVVIGKSRYHRTLSARLLLPHTQDFFSSGSCCLDLQRTGHLREVDGPGHTGIAVVPLPSLPR